MKFRKGFVSNSSTSNFVIIGQKWDDNEKSLKEIDKLYDFGIFKIEDENERLNFRYNQPENKDGLTLIIHGEEGNIFVGIGDESDNDYKELTFDNSLFSKFKGNKPIKLFYGQVYR